MKIFTAPKTYDSAISPYIRLYYASKNIPFAHNIGAAENSLSPFFSAHASLFPAVERDRFLLRETTA